MGRPGNRGRRFAAAVSIAALSMFAFAASAWGVAQTIIASDDFYTAASYTMDQGDVVPFQNAGTSSHDATARLTGPDGEPLFFNSSIGAGTTTVKGTQYLTAGSYAFFCTVHPLSMAGTLSVSGAGAPVARPQITVGAVKAKISKVAKKGKLPVTVTAATKSDGIELQVKLGKAVAGTQKAFNLAAGQKKTFQIKLSKATKNKLKNSKKATFKIAGSVPFGAPSSAKSKVK